jgi:hypothetical protein
MSRSPGLFKYVVIGAVAGFDLALWVAVVGGLVS